MKRNCLAVCFLVVFAVSTMIVAPVGAKCTLRNCNGRADCDAAKAEWYQCMDAERAAIRESNKQELERKHKQELEAIEKINEANKKVKKVGTQ